MRSSDLQLFVLCVLIWGTTWIAITFQFGAVSPEVSVGWRFALAALLCAAWCAWRGHALRFAAGTHALLAAFGAIMFCAGYVSIYYAETLIVSGLVATGYSASPLLNMAVGRLMLRTPISRRVALGGVLGIAGIGCVFWPELSRVEGDARVVLGVALTMAGVLTSAFGNVLATMLERRGLNVWQKLSWGMVYGAAGCFLLAFALGHEIGFDWRPGYVISFLYLTVLGSIVAFAAYLALLSRIGSGPVGYIGVTIPIVALIVSAMFEDYAWTPLTVVGIALAAAGNVAVLRRGGRN